MNYWTEAPISIRVRYFDRALDDGSKGLQDLSGILHLRLNHKDLSISMDI